MFDINSSLDDHVAQELARLDVKDTFRRVHAHLMEMHEFEGFSQVFHMIDVFD